jgi:hypothetical protein
LRGATRAPSRPRCRPTRCPSNHPTLKANAGRAVIRLKRFDELRAEKPAGSVNRFVLLDAQDWMTDILLAARWAGITRTAALAIIPEWERALAAAASALAIGGSLHVVDFGEQEQLPRWFRGELRVWLRRFHVEPRAMLPSALAAEAEQLGGRLTIPSLHRGYALHAVLRRGTRLAVRQRPAYSVAPAIAATSAWGL